MLFFLLQEVRMPMKMYGKRKKPKALVVDFSYIINEGEAKKVD